MIVVFLVGRLLLFIGSSFFENSIRFGIVFICVFSDVLIGMVSLTFVSGFRLDYDIGRRTDPSVCRNSASFFEDNNIYPGTRSRASISCSFPSRTQVVRRAIPPFSLATISPACLGNHNAWFSSGNDVSASSDRTGKDALLLVPTNDSVHHQIPMMTPKSIQSCKPADRMTANSIT